MGHGDSPVIARAIEFGPPTGLSHCRTSFWIRNLEIEILGAETGTQKAAQTAKLYEIWGAETRLDSAKSPKRRSNFICLDMANRDRTDWLAWPAFIKLFDHALRTYE
jgi:hypothetical protein